MRRALEEGQRAPYAGNCATEKPLEITCEPTRIRPNRVRTKRYRNRLLKRLVWCSMLDLTNDDYDSLYAVVRDENAADPRDIFPKILKQLVDTGVLAVSVTEDDIAATTPAAPETGVYRVQRQRRLH